MNFTRPDFRKQTFIFFLPDVTGMSGMSGMSHDITGMSGISHDVTEIPGMT